MDIDRRIFLDGEKLLLSKASNAVFKISDYGLKSLPYDQLMSVMGFNGKEAIGGKLHLTNYRLIFKSHPLNRVTGKFSIFLPTINSVLDTSQFLTKKIEVSTHTQNFEFILWGIPSFIQAINSASNSLTETQKTDIKNYVKKDYEKVGDGLKISKVMDKIALKMPDTVNQVLEIAQDPISLTGILNVLELLEMIMKDGE
ncbi:hypothetical protein H5968_01925 [Sphaerospermopsis sp. LEGE 00249]|uniref:GRAM domain-containing protein n=1 Tax=Sphaerospermopsis sp. LEGE 00249 TaxID=1380707 RepID=UPI00164E5F5D|nr:GRAM domain-containing protein [Sphaerospermopsis sp. LEGE 00249]MBC5793935.1 hypothetical protein [Sphaerospermopsis sp. LEGE 00249]